MNKLSNENILWATIQSSSLLLATVDNDLKFTSINNAYERWFNLKKSKVIGLSLVEIIGEDAFLKLHPYLELAFAGELVSFELEYPHYFGGERLLRISYIPIILFDNKINGLYFIIEDITANVRSEFSLKKKKRFFFF